MSVTKAHGVRPDGSFGVIGFRAHCPRCGYLSHKTPNYNYAHEMLSKHRKVCRDDRP